jgi:hypothetical protein
MATQGAQLFVNNIAEPGNVDTLINLHNGEVGIGTATLSNRGPGLRGETNHGAGLVVQTIQGINVIEAFRINQLVFAVQQNGTVLADGPFTGPADFAEMLPVGAEAECEPGDVLKISADGTMARADSCNATNVAGVYSTRPGFVGDMRHSSLQARANAAASAAAAGGARAAYADAGAGADAGAQSQVAVDGCPSR